MIPMKDCVLLVRHQKEAEIDLLGDKIEKSGDKVLSKLS